MLCRRLLRIWPFDIWVFKFRQISDHRKAASRLWQRRCIRISSRLTRMTWQQPQNSIQRSLRIHLSWRTLYSWFNVPYVVCDMPDDTRKRHVALPHPKRELAALMPDYLLIFLPQAAYMSPRRVSVAGSAGLPYDKRTRQLLARRLSFIQRSAPARRGSRLRHLFASQQIFTRGGLNNLLSSGWCSYVPLASHTWFAMVKVANLWLVSMLEVTVWRCSGIRATVC